MSLRSKRWLVILLVAVFFVSSNSTLLGTGGTIYAAPSFAGGDGTADNPFQIATAEQLNEIRNHLDRHFMLMNDIDLSAFDASNPWVPIGNDSTPFTGSFDGQHYKIMNLSIVSPDSDQPVGLFGVVNGPTGYIANLIVEAVEIRGDYFVGVLAGKSSAVIQNVGVTGSVYGNRNVGGLIGRGDNGNVSYSYAAADVSGGVEVGGLIGKQLYNVVTYSYASGQVTGCEDVGGLVGDNDHSLISNSFAAGAVRGMCDNEYESDSLGGLAGDSSDGDVVNSFAIGKVTGGFPIGGLVGSSGGEITNSFYNKETTGQSDAKGQGLTTEEMKDKQNYIGWDFDTIWDIQPPHHDGYPYVRAVQAFITYAENGTDHSNEPYLSRSYLPDSSVEVEEKPGDWVKTGYRFRGWNTEADGSGERIHAHDSIVMNGNLLLFADWEPLPAPVPESPANGEYINETSPEIRGSAEAGATVVIMLDGQEAASVTADEDGIWSWIPAAELEEGLHIIRAGIADREGDIVSLSAEHRFTVDTIPPVITLAGEEQVTITAGTAFVDPGATVADSDDDVAITVTGSVDSAVPGTYLLHYDAQDRAGNAAATVTRTVQVVERSSGGGGGGGYQPSDNANLAQLTVWVNEDEALALTPTFAAGTTEYRTETTADQVRLEAVPANASASVTLDEASHVQPVTVPLLEGDNTFEFKVRAEDGSIKTYSLTIHRQIPTVEPVVPVCPFRDTKGHWAELLICEAYGIGIVEGYSETTFQPDQSITRVEFAAMLLRTLGIPLLIDVNEIDAVDHEDIPAWAIEVVGTAAAHGVLEGYPDRTLRPVQRVTRAEMVAMIAKALKWDDELGDANIFADDAELPEWAKGYIYGAAQRDLVNGREGNRFHAMDAATRAEATTLLLRLRHMLEQ